MDSRNIIEEKKYFFDHSKKMQVPFIKEGIDDLASNGVESQIVDVLQVISAETNKPVKPEVQKKFFFVTVWFGRLD